MRHALGSLHFSPVGPTLVSANPNWPYEWRKMLVVQGFAQWLFVDAQRRITSPSLTWVQELSGRSVKGPRQLRQQ